MEQAQIQKLKINATNIKNTLTFYNNQSIKLRKDEFRFSFTEEKKKKLREKEQKIETKEVIQQPLEKIKSKILAGPMSFFDKVKEFFGIIFLGLVINNLPKIIDKVTEVGKTLISVVNSIIKVVEATVNGVNGFISIIQNFPETTKRKLIEEKDKLENFIFELDKIIDPMNREYTKLDKDLKSKSTNSKSKDNSLTNNSDETQITQKKSRGGTVKKQTTKSTITGTFRGVTPTPMGKKAIESTNAFETFATVAEQVKEHSVLLDGKGGVNENFAGVNESFNQFLISLRDIEDKDKSPVPPGPGKSPPGGTSPGSTEPSVPGNGKISGGADVTQRNDPDGQQTGIDIALRDSSGGFGIGALIRNPFESLKITGTGFQGSGSGSKGKGFGLYVTGEAVVDGKRYQLLVGHLDKSHVKKGDVLSGGDSIGTQGISGHATGPHVSTHVNALDGGNAQLILNAVEKSWTNGTLIKSQNMKPGKGAVNPIANNKASKISQSPEDSLMAMGGVDFFFTQIIEKPIPFPMPMPVRVNSSNESSNNSLPEINPLLLV